MVTATNDTTTRDPVYDRFDRELSPLLPADPPGPGWKIQPFREAIWRVAGDPDIRGLPYAGSRLLLAYRRLAQAQLHEEAHQVWSVLLKPTDQGRHFLERVTYPISKLAKELDREERDLYDEFLTALWHRATTGQGNAFFRNFNQALDHLVLDMAKVWRRKENTVSIDEVEERKAQDSEKPATTILFKNGHVTRPEELEERRDEDRRERELMSMLCRYFKEWMGLDRTPHQEKIARWKYRFAAGRLGCADSGGSAMSLEDFVKHVVAEAPGTEPRTVYSWVDAKGLAAEDVLRGPVSYAVAAILEETKQQSPELAATLRGLILELMNVRAKAGRSAREGNDLRNVPAPRT